MTAAVTRLSSFQVLAIGQCDPMNKRIRVTPASGDQCNALFALGQGFQSL
jgi:hypothetical protein